MFSSSGDIVCSSIIEILDIFNERLGTYCKFRLKLGGGGGGGTYLSDGHFGDKSKKGRFLSYLSNGISKSK